MLFPPSTNDQYRGSVWAAWFLVAVALLMIVPGAIHYFLPDGGAGVIAGIDMGGARAQIVAVFAWYGAMQMPFGLLLLAIALRYRPLVPLALVAVIVMQALSAWSAWFGKGSYGRHHPPEHFGSVVILGLALGFLTLALRRQATRR